MREHARAMAARIRLRYEEMNGTTDWLSLMMAQKREEGFVVSQPRATMVCTLRRRDFRVPARWRKR